MKKTIISCIIIIIQLFIGYQVLKGTNSIIETVNFSINIWRNNIFPALFPFFVLSEIMINYGFVEFISELFKPLMYKLFKIKGETAFIFIMSIISGFPSSAKYTKELYNNGLINEHEASKILTFTHFSNPIFILGTVSLVFLNNKEAGLLILIVHYATNIILGLIFRNYYPSNSGDNKMSLKKAIINMHNHRINNPLNFGQIITQSIKNTINTLLIILGTITTFLVITTIIDNVINLNNYNQSILNGFFEMTQGLKYVSILDIPLRLKATISAMIISFGGLSVHMQVISIISDTKIKYIPFLTARLLHASIASFIVYILFDWWIMIH
jgi:sporulation integral membrane protein YlbJ